MLQGLMQVDLGNDTHAIEVLVHISSCWLTNAEVTEEKYQQHIQLIQQDFILRSLCLKTMPAHNMFPSA